MGLTTDELQSLAESAAPSPSEGATPAKLLPTVKTSRRDLAVVLSKQWNGGTTVAGTLIIADLVGIRLFATGGIGK